MADKRKTFYARSAVLCRLTFFILFLLAIGIRIYGILNHPVEFQYVRQYHSALLARYFYFQSLPVISEWQNAVIQVTTPRIHEPPIMEWLAVLGYHLAGGEQLWVPRLLTAFFWVAGGIALYALLRRFFDREVTLLSTAFYLLAPYGIFLSLSFQPDSLMVMMLLFSLLAIVWFYEKNDMPRLLAASTLSGLALLIKPVTVFLIFGAFIGLGLAKLTTRKLIFARFFWLFSIITLVPAVLYYLYQTLGGGVLGGVAQKSILPGLLLHLYYYKGWLYQVERVLGFPVLIAGLAGTLMFVEREARFFAWGLWSGYLAFGMVFTWPFTTHAYYHIVLVPVIAFCLAPLLQSILESIKCQKTWFVRPIFLGILLFLFAITIKPVLGEIRQSDYSKMVAVSKEIGEAVQHSTRTVLLSPHEGEPLMYHGWLAGKTWPGSWALRREKFGLSKMTDFQPLNREINLQAVKRRFDEDYKPFAPEYFIVTNLAEFNQQPDLQEFLASNFNLSAKTESYLIFDLRTGKGKF